jgi:hypothetical protein
MSGYTQQDYEAISAAIAQGTRRVRIGDRDVEYRSLDEMLRIRGMMAKELNMARRPNRVVSSFSKGFAK